MPKLISFEEYNKLMDETIKTNEDLPIAELLLLLLDTFSDYLITGKPKN